MPKLMLVLLVVLVTSGMEIAADKALGIDLSEVSTFQKIAHGVVYKITGAAIAAVVWLT